MALPNNPQTRKEMYLSNMAGQGTALPSEPHTREEEYLDYIAKNGGGGGTGEGDMTKAVYDDDLAVASAGGIADYVAGAITGKVDKVQGKGLSSNDYDDSAKAIVDNVTTDLDAKQPKTLSEPIYVDGIAKFSVETAIDAVNDLAASNKSALATKATTAQIAAIQDGQNIDSFGDVETALEGAFPRSEQAVLGAVNLFNTFDAPFSDVGLPVTKNADGTITLGAGTATGEFLFPSSYNANYYSIQPNTDYVFSIGDVDVSGTGIKLEVYYAINKGSWTQLKSVANVKYIDFNVPAQSTDIVAIWARVGANRVILSSDKLLKPIISTSLQPYVPFAMTNMDLTKKLAFEETVATVDPGSASNITLDSNLNWVVKQGSVVNFTVRFTLANASSTGDYYIFHLPYAPQKQYPLFSVLDRNAPYDYKCGAYLNSAGAMGISGIALPAGSYQMSGTYICK